MLKSDQIAAEIRRLATESDARYKLIEEQIAAATKHFKQLKHFISEFAQAQSSAIETEEKSCVQSARDAFSKEYNNLREQINSNNTLTCAPWDESWNSFNIERERPAHNLTRIGKFLFKGENESLEMPAMFPILGGKNIMLRATGCGRLEARRILRNIALRLLASLPPGKLRFCFVDPVELGSIAAGLVGALPDFLTNGIAWHQEQDIEEQLSLMETRIAAIKTKCLGINFNSLEEYNADPKTKIQEPYWLVVVSDCPVRFRDGALQKLLSIAKNGPQAGVHLAIMLDDSQKKCTDELVIELAETAHHIACSDNIFFDDSDFKDVGLRADEPPPIELVARITEQVCRIASSAQSVRVNWEPPSVNGWWGSDSRSGLKIPLGIYGAREIQIFEIDDKLLSSALIVGKAGSGKSRLLHVLVAGIATHYSPDEVGLYLLDCKQVEFKEYANSLSSH